MGWSVDESIHKFTDLCGKAFKERTLSNVPLIGWLVNHDHHSKYQTTDLQHALVSSFTRERYLFGGISREPRKPEDIPHVKVAVTAASIQRGKALVLANYNRSEGDPQRSMKTQTPFPPSLFQKALSALRKEAFICLKSRM